MAGLSARTARGTEQVREEAQALASHMMVSQHHHEEQLQRFILADRRHQLEALVQACHPPRCLCLATHAPRSSSLHTWHLLRHFDLYYHEQNINY